MALLAMVLLDVVKPYRLASMFRAGEFMKGVGYAGKPSWAGIMRIVKIRNAYTGGPP